MARAISSKWKDSNRNREKNDNKESQLIKSVRVRPDGERNNGKIHFNVIEIINVIFTYNSFSFDDTFKANRKL